MLSPLVSIIVPVFNAEKYIPECIESVLNQTYQKWELILIDDGSVDRSLELCYGFSHTDRRIKVYTQKNTGVSSARNLGLDVACGTYVIFLDSDDYWIDCNIISKLVSYALNYGTDVVRGEFQEVDENGLFLRLSERTAMKAEYSKSILNEKIFLDKIIAQEYFTVLCLFRKQVIGSLRFNITRVFLEDAEFYLRLFMQPLRCIYISDCFYAYRKHNLSVSVRNIPNKFRDAVSFTILCLELGAKLQDVSHKLVYIKEGIRNFKYDVSVIAESNLPLKGIKHVVTENKMKQIKMQIFKVALYYRIWDYIAFLVTPLFLTIYWNRTLAVFKRMVKRIIVFSAK